MSIRILIADDQQLMLEGLETILELEPGLEVVGLAKNGREAVALAEKLQPDVILMDVRMPELDGVEATRLIKERWPHLQVIILTTYDHDEYVFRALSHGAAGYLLKDLQARQLVEAIRRVQAGETFISPQVAAKVVAELARLRGGKKEPRDEGLEELTEREAEVLRLVAQGYSNKEIASRLYLTEGTVKNYISSIYGKLGTSNRVQAVLYAHRRGLVPPGDEEPSHD